MNNKTLLYFTVYHSLLKCYYYITDEGTVYKVDYLGVTLDGGYFTRGRYCNL